MKRALLALLPLVAATLGACTSEDENQARAGAGGATGAAGGTGSGLAPFVPPGDPGPGKVLVTASGEAFALEGFPFHPGSSEAGDPAFVDGWSVRFSHVLVTYGDVALTATPDLDPNDKSKLGAEVARLSGPFAVDHARGGPLPGKGGPGEQAVALGALDASLDAKERYAVSYTSVAATAGAKNVNLDAEGLALYETAIAKGWSTVYAGTATYAGPPPAAGTPFDLMPASVSFVVGLENPSKQLNCENPDLGKSAVGEDFPRGVQPLASQSVVLQLTFHTDHLFWDRLEAESVPLHFDVFAARSSGFGQKGAKTGSVSVDDLAGADVTALVAKDGTPIPFRSLVPDYTAPGGTLAYDPNGVSITGNDLARWLAFTSAASHHLNADGECLAVPLFAY